jgi:hypothetical protein
MKIITSSSPIGEGLIDFFPSLAEFKTSTKVKLCPYRSSAGAEFTYYSYPVLVISIFGDYQQEHLDEITRLSKIRPGQQVIVPTPIKQPQHWNKPDNVHWLTFPSMYSVYVRHASTKDVIRPAVQKHFISANHRYTWFRQELFYYMYQNKLLDTSYFSYAGNDRFNEGTRRLFDQGNQVIGENRYPGLNKDIVYNMLPYKNFVESNPPVNNIPVSDFQNIQPFYNTAAVAIESETYMETFLDYNPGLTEKTLKPLILGNPFLIYSNRGTLKLLRELGFETFGKIIDESYDDIESPQQRWEALLVQIKELSKVNPQALIDSVVDVCEHNQNHIINTQVDRLTRDEETIYTLIKSLV